MPRPVLPMALVVLVFGLLATAPTTAWAQADEEPPKDMGAPPAMPGDNFPQSSPAPSADTSADDADVSSEPTAPAAGTDSMTIKMHPKANPIATEKKTSKSKKTVAKKTKNKKKTKETEVAETPVKKDKSSKPDGETVLTWLKNGNTRFVKKKFRADGKNSASREKLVSGEKPNAAILADSDSRVVPEIIFDQGLGEIYTVRTFGEALDDSTIAALEYAVGKLKVPLIIVMGNSDSAALRVLSTSKVNENGDELSDEPKSDSLQEVIDQIRPRLKTVAHDPPSPHYEVEATLNADGIARELKKKSEIIAKAVKEGHLKIQSALYRLNTGKVSFY